MLNASAKVLQAISKHATQLDTLQLLCSGSMGEDFRDAGMQALRALQPLEVFGCNLLPARSEGFEAAAQCKTLSSCTCSRCDGFSLGLGGCGSDQTTFQKCSDAGCLLGVCDGCLVAGKKAGQTQRHCPACSFTVCTVCVPGKECGFSKYYECKVLTRWKGEFSCAGKWQCPNCCPSASCALCGEGVCRDCINEQCGCDATTFCLDCNPRTECAVCRKLCCSACEKKGLGGGGLEWICGGCAGDGSV